MSDFAKRNGRIVAEMLATMGDDSQEAADKRKASWYSWVRELFTRLDHYKPCSVMMRPADLPEDDGKLYLSLQTYRRKGSRASAEITETAIEFGDWKGAVELS